MKLATALSLALLLLPVAAVAAAWEVGPPVGAKAPPVHATDLKGTPVKLRALSGKNGLVLVFFRSAKWCPYCQNS